MILVFPDYNYNLNSCILEVMDLQEIHEGNPNHLVEGHFPIINGLNENRLATLFFLATTKQLQEH